MNSLNPEILTKAIRTVVRIRETITAAGNRFLNFFTPSHTRRLAAVLLSAFLVVVIVSARADAQSDAVKAVADGADKTTAFLFSIINTILLAIIQTVGQLASIVVSILVGISQFNKFSTVKVVDVGWTIVKDVSNMLFIIALLVIAAGTVLRLENYKYNRLLSNLIIMAFLTNFSKFIAAFFIQGAQVLMLTFVNAYKDALFGNFTSAFGLDQILHFSPNAETMTQMSIFGNLLGGLILTVIALIITAAICIVLFARIVALWILVILSPFAFASQILPNTKSFASRWWSEFGKYVTQGPILAFFLWLALAIVSVGNGASSADPSLGQIATDIDAARSNATFFQTAAFTADNLMTFVISAAFLMFGLQYATSSSGAAGKWAGKVASAGFAGAATVSGINAIRDRTVAPVQGWIKNRGAARQAAIQERTQTLEAAGDRLRARVGDASVGVGRFRVGPGQAGAEKAQAAAAAYERQRTQRFTASRGLNDMTTAELQDRMQNSRDQREQLASLQVLQGRGAMNLADPFQRDAFEKVVANQRLPGGEKKKLREELVGNYAKGLNEDQARTELANAREKTDRIIYARRLQEVNALKVGNTADEGIIRSLRSDLADSPDKLRGFDESLMKSNQDMAKKVLFNDLETIADRRNLLLAVQQRQISASVLNKDTQEKFAVAKDGNNQEGEISRFLVENSRDEAALRGFYNQIDPEAAREIFKHVDMKGETSLERRAMVAKVTGEMGKAFTDATNTYMADEAKKYADKLGGEELAKNISVDSLESDLVLKTLNESANMKFPHWKSIRNRNKETRTALTKGLAAYAGKLEQQSPGGKIDLDPKNKEGNFVVSNLALASKGKDLRHDLSSEQGQRAYTNLVRSAEAADIADLNESRAFQNAETRRFMTETYGMNGDPAKIADMLQYENYDFAVESLAAGEKELLKRWEDKEDAKAYSRLRQMAANPVLSGFVKTPRASGKKKGGSGAAVAAVPTTPAPDQKPADQKKKKGTPDSPTEPPQRQSGFTAKWDDDKDKGTDASGGEAPVTPTPPKPRGPSGATQNILIGNLTPEQRQARQEVIKVRQANKGKIPDAQFKELAGRILDAQDLQQYQRVSSIPPQALNDEDRQLLQEMNTKLGLHGTDVQAPAEYLTPPQLAARQELQQLRTASQGRLSDKDLKRLGETILGSNQLKDFQRLAGLPSQILTDTDRELLKDLSIRLGYLEPGA